MSTANDASKGWSALVAARRGVEVDPSWNRGRGRFDGRVGPNDLGRVIGKRGKTAQAIRTVVRAAASRDGVDVDVDFLD